MEKKIIPILFETMINSSITKHIIAIIDYNTISSNPYRNKFVSVHDKNNKIRYGAAHMPYLHLK